MTSTLDSTPGTPLRHLPGNFYYADLHTGDVDSATSFYGSLFGWNIEQMPDVPMPYRPADIDGRMKAAITALTSEQLADDTAPYWCSYLTVADVDAALERVTELGGTVLQPAYDVLDMGRMAVIQDPTGAALGIWQDFDPTVTSVLDEPGTPFWHELHSTDAERAIGFYTQLVGWTRQDNDMGDGLTYTVMETPGPDHLFQRSTAAIMQHMESAADSPSFWAVIFNVADPDATAAKAAELGGSVLMGPFDIPGGVGRLAWLADPQGAKFAVMKPIPPSDGGGAGE